jgi:hypothetical protein
MKVLLERSRTWLRGRRQLRLERAQRRAMMWRGGEPGGAGRPEDIYGQSVRQMGQNMGDS